MIDARFYVVSGSPDAAEIAQWGGGFLVRGDGKRKIASVAGAGEAGPDDLTFLDDADPKTASALRAGVCFVTPGLAKQVGAGPALIETAVPRAAFARAARSFIKVRDIEAGQPFIHPSAKLADGAAFEPGVVIGAGAALGRNVRIGANTVIGAGVQIGNDTGVGRNASIRYALIGDGVSIASGAMIGERGFGLVGDGAGASLLPHYGRVIIQNGCSVGANSCIDRGFLEDTVLGERVHIDNLCHIGHNVRIGSGAVMAAFAGVSGSSQIGEGVQFGGRVGVGDHIHVGTGARVAAGAAVLKDVPAGETHAGYPAKEIGAWKRELAWLKVSAQKRGQKDD